MAGASLPAEDRARFVRLVLDALDRPASLARR